MLKKAKVVLSFTLAICMMFSLSLLSALATPPTENPLLIEVNSFDSGEATILSNAISPDRKTITTTLNLPVEANVSNNNLKTKTTLLLKGDSAEVSQTLLTADTIATSGTVVTIKLAVAVPLTYHFVNVKIAGEGLKTAFYNQPISQELCLSGPMGEGWAYIDKAEPIIKEIYDPETDDVTDDITASADNKTFTITFTEPIFNALPGATPAAKAAALKAAVTVLDDEGNPLNPPQTVSSVAIANDKMTIVLGRSFSNSYYTPIKLAANSIQDLAGNKNALPIFFHTIAKMDTTPASITGITLSPDFRTITAQFNESISLLTDATALRNAIRMYNPWYPSNRLKSGDTVEVKGSQLIIKLRKAITPYPGTFEFGLGIVNPVLKDVVGNVTTSAGGGFGNYSVPQLTAEGSVSLSADNKTLSLHFTETIMLDDPTAVKSAISVANPEDTIDPEPDRMLTPLGADDKVAITGNRLVVTFKNPITKLTGINVKPFTVVDIFGAFVTEEIASDYIDPDGATPAFTAVEVSPNNKVISLLFPEATIANASTASSAAAKLADLKSKIKRVTLSGETETVSDLATGDTIKLVGLNKLEITLATAPTSTTEDFKIRLLAGALKDGAGLSNAQLTTSFLTFNLSKPVIEWAELEDFNRKVTFGFNEAITLGSGVTAATLVSKIKVNGLALPTGAKASIVDGNTLVITFTAGLAVGDNLFSIEAGAVRDLAGNAY